MTLETFKAYIQTHKIAYNRKLIPVLHQNEAYKYFGIQLIPSLKWNLQRQITTNPPKQTTKHHLQKLNKKLKFINTILRPIFSSLQFSRNTIFNPKYKKIRQKNHIRNQNNMQST